MQQDLCLLDQKLRRKIEGEFRASGVIKWYWGGLEGFESLVLNAEMIYETD